MKAPIDEIDKLIANLILDYKGNLDLMLVPLNYEYVNGDGDIRI